MADQVAINGSAMRTTGDGGMDGLEQIRLAGAIRGGDDRESMVGRDLGVVVAAKVLQDQPRHLHGGTMGSARDGAPSNGVRRHGVQRHGLAYDAVRTGMMTWT